MGIIDRLLVRFILWFGLPVLLLLLVVGPRKLWRRLQFGWHWLFQRRLQPEELLAHALRQLQDHIAAVRRALAQAEATEAELRDNVRKSEQNMTSLEAEARNLVAKSTTRRAGRFIQIESRADGDRQFSGAALRDSRI